MAVKKPTETREEVFERNRKKHGGKLICHICGKEITPQQEKNAVKEHKDNDPKNNHPDNLDAAHKSCNKKKDPSNVIKLLRSKELTLNHIYTHTRTHRFESISLGTEAMRRNAVGKPRLRKWLDKKLKKTGYMLLSEFIESGAEVADVQMKTIESWLPPMTSNEGRYRVREIKGLKYIMTKYMAEQYDRDIRGGSGDTSPDMSF